MEIDFSTLFTQKNNIKSISLWLQYYGANKIDIFLNKCPLTQKLELYDCDQEINGLMLKDLIRLTLFDCGPKCRFSILNSSKSSLRSLQIINSNSVDQLTDKEYYEMPHLDTLSISENSFSRVSEIKSKFFSENEKVIFLS